MIVYFNGSFIEKEKVAISPDDRGFVFADGIYEVVRWYRTYFFAFSDHMLRLSRSLGEIRIELAEKPDFFEIAMRLVKENNLTGQDAVLYFQITRGAAKRNHPFPETSVKPTVYIALSPFLPSSEMRFQGIKVISLPDERWSRCDIKTVGLLPNILAKQKAVESNAYEAILIRNGKVTEASHSNVFGIKAGTLYSHPDSGYVLPGIARKITLTICRGLGIPVELSPIPADELDHMDELFITNTSGEILGITHLDGKLVSGGVPGKLTNKLTDAFISYREAHPF
jgi:D-alanine transaminase